MSRIAVTWDEFLRVTDYCQCVVCEEIFDDSSRDGLRGTSGDWYCHACWDLDCGVHAEEYLRDVEGV